MQRRTTTGLCVAAVLGFGVALGAQTSTSTTPGQRTDRPGAREINVTGCVARGADGEFTLTNARIEPMGSASSTTAGTSGTTSTTAGTTGATTTATEPAGSGTKANAATTWRLSGGSDLDKHVGHTVQITGRASGDKTMDSASPPSTSTTPSATTAADSKGPELEVQSIKMISTSCS